MTTSVIYLGALGGLISFASTAFGAFLALTPWRSPSFLRFKISIDFALGLMLSAVAFSLVGPAASESAVDPMLLALSAAGFCLGAVGILSLKVGIERRESAAHKVTASSSQLLLALALLVHNFPEGLASGASLAGLEFAAATPILTSISLQNVPEGLLMVLCLRSLGWSQGRALLGGLASGLVELVGGLLAGVALTWASALLPVMLMMAGGAMFTSVIIEMKSKGALLPQVAKPQFAVGLLSIPILNMLI